MTAHRCPWAIVLRYRHPNALPAVESVHETASAGWAAGFKAKAAWPAEVVTVLHEGQEHEVRL